MKRVTLAGLAVAACLAPAWSQEARSKVWPIVDEGVAHMIEGLPNAECLGYPMPEDAEEPPEGIHAVVELPTYLELISNTFRYSRPMDRPAVKEMTRDGRPYRRYTFPPVQGVSGGWAKFWAHWVPRPTDADRQDPGVFAWHFVTPDGPEPEQSRPIELLPELPDVRPPERITSTMYTCPALNMEPPALPLGLELVQRTGINLLGAWESTPEALAEAGCGDMGIRLQLNHGGISGWPDMAPSGPEEYTRDRHGEIVERQDPQYVLDRDGEPWARSRRVAASLAARGYVLAEDIEWQPVFDTGFSEAGIRAFAEMFDLNAGELTPQIIWERHRTRWGDFRADQYLRLAAYLTEAAHEANPDCLVTWLPGAPYTTTDGELMSDMIELGEDDLGRMVYCIFPFPTGRMHEGFDILQPMWYSHGIGQVRMAFERCRAIVPRITVPLMPLFLGQGREFYYPGGDPGEVLRAMIWAALLGGAEGYGFWQNEFSSLQLTWLARANREVAEVEDVLMDGGPDPAGVEIEPMPKRRFTLVSGEQRRVFPVPDFYQVALNRAFAHGDRRLIGIINLDQGLEVYYRLRVAGLPAGDYACVNVSEEALVVPEADALSFTAEQLAAGLTMVTPAQYGVTLLDIRPAEEADVAELGRQVIADIEAAYADCREPDTEGALLAQRGGLTIRYDVAPGAADPLILLESADQQVWLNPHSGGVIRDWLVREGARRPVRMTQPQAGAAMDLFWSPPDAQWSGDERAAYEVLYTKIHGGKAYVRLRQVKSNPALSGLVLTKTIAIPERGTDVEVAVDIENQGPAPEVGFCYWAHHMFQVGREEPAAVEEQRPEIYMQTGEGVARAPTDESAVWTRPDEPTTPGNENWERKARNGVTTGDWIAQYSPATGEAVLCQVEHPSPAQFYSWRQPDTGMELSCEWMYPHVVLPAGESWETRYLLRYVPEVEPEQLPKRLLPSVP